jgi:hypothetical protein
MPLQDYEELDDDDFYGQEFEKDDVVSIWVGSTDPSDADPNLDVLQDLCGVGYYALDNQEIIIEDHPTAVADLVAALSYSDSFAKAVVRATGAKERGRWIVAQYDFAYDLKRVKRSPAKDPRFLGVFPYAAD